MGQSESIFRQIADANPKKIEEFKETKFKALWLHFDTDNSGFLEGEEISRFFSSIFDYMMKDSLQYGISEENKDNIISSWINHFDVNHDSKLDTNEFTKAVINLIARVESTSKIQREESHKKFVKAVKISDTKSVRDLLEKGLLSSTSGQLFQNKDSALEFAIKKPDYTPELITLLVQKADTEDWISVIKYAARKGNPDLLHLLIEARNKNQLEICYKNGSETTLQTALNKAWFYAAVYNQVDTMKEIQTKHLNFNFNPTEMDVALLPKLASMLSFGPTQYLLSQLQNNNKSSLSNNLHHEINEVGLEKDGIRTPVLCCALQAKTSEPAILREYVQLLLSYGADPNGAVTDSTFDGYQYALGLAVRIDDKDLVQLLLKHGAQVNQMSTWMSNKNIHTGTALHIAARTGHADVASVLLEYKADITLKNLRGNTPVEVAKGTKLQDLFHGVQ